MWINCETSVGRAAPSQSGHVTQAVAAAAPRRAAPGSAGPTAARSAEKLSQAAAPGRARVTAPGQRTTTARIVRSARRISALARCAVTQVCGSSRTTTTPPMTAWSTNRMPALTASGRSSGAERKRAIVHSASAATPSPDRSASRRWTHSIRVARSSDGRNWPWQSGQSGQPSPDPVTRTMPPQIVTRRVARSVSQTSPRYDEGSAIRGPERKASSAAPEARLVRRGDVLLERTRAVDGRDAREVVGGRGRARGPFQRVALPRVVAGALALLERDAREEVVQEDQHAQRHHVRADRRDEVERLPLRRRRVAEDAARHALEAQLVLDEEGQVEADEHQQEVDL